MLNSARRVQNLRKKQKLQYLVISSWREFKKIFRTVGWGNRKSRTREGNPEHFMTREFGRGQVSTPLHEIIYLVGVARCSYRKQICLIYQIQLKYFKSFMHHFVWKKEQWNNCVFTNYQSRVCWFKTTRWFHGQDLVVSSKLSPWNGSTGLRHLNSIHWKGL